MQAVNLPILRNSERRDFKRCPTRWWWGWREGLKPQGPPNEKLWFGTGIHLALALWYKPGRKRGIDPRITWRKFVADDITFIRTEFGKFDPTSYMEAGKYGEQLLGWYLEEYGRDQSWDVIAPEQTFEVIVPDADGNPVVRLVGTFDGVYRDLDTGELKLMEHKTAAQIVLTHLPMDDQGGTYITVATFALRDQGLIGPEETVTEITYNFLRKGKKDERPKDSAGLTRNKPIKKHYLEQLGAMVNAKMKLEEMAGVAARHGVQVFGDVSENQPTPLFHREPVTRTRAEQATQLRRIADEVAWMRDVRDGYLPLIKNNTRDCSWDCDFYTMCELHEGDPTEAVEFRNAIYRVQDPYADHRKSAAV